MRTELHQTPATLQAQELALQTVQQFKRQAMLLSQEMLVDNLLVCLGIQSEMIKRIEVLEAKVLRRRPRA